MKTMMKTAAFVTALLLAGAAAAIAEDAAPKATGPGWGPGWRHQQMAEAWEKGQVPPGPMMMMRGQGPAGRFGPPIGADGKIDTSKLPEWCPMRQALEQPK